MKVDIKEPSEVERQLHIEVSAEEMAREREITLKAVQKKASVKGFRPGKVPFQVLEKLYEHDIDHDLKDRVLLERSRKIFRDHSLIPIGRAIVEHLEFEKGKALIVDLKVEVKPKLSFDDSLYKGLKLTHPSFVASPEELEAELARLQERHAALEPVAEGTALCPGLVALIDFEGHMGGNPFPGGTAKAQMVELGKGRMLPDFENALHGLKNGDTTSIDLTFPEDYFGVELRGKQAVFKIIVHDVKKKNLPLLDDEFAKDLGTHQTLSALKEDLGKQIAVHKKQAFKLNFYDQILTQLTQAVQCPVPPSLLAQEKNMLAESRRGHAHSDGDEDLTAEAMKRIRGDFILEQIAEKESCQVEAQDLENRVREIAMTNRQSPMEVINYYKQHQLFPYLNFQVLIQKALDKVVDYATFVEE